MTKSIKKEVVIVGGGFAGITLARELLNYIPSRFKITLIDKKNYHLFQPALYKAATTFAEPSSIFSGVAIDFKDIFLNKNVSFIKNEVKDVSFEEDYVILRGGKVLQYDYLVLALGSSVDFRNITGAEKYSLTLKSFENAIAIKSKLEEVVKNHPKRKEINVAIAGAGFTGCELASEMVGYLNKLADIYGHPRGSLRVKLIERQDKVVPSAGLWLQEKTGSRLKSLGIEVFLKSPIKEVTQNELILDNGSFVPYDLLVWTMGMKPNIFIENLEINLSPSLRVNKKRNVFALGDFIIGKISPAVGYRGGSARAAVHQAKYVAKKLLKDKTKDYKPLKPKFVNSLGDKYGVADLGFIKFGGILAWRLRNLIFLDYFTSILPWKKAFKIYKNYRAL